MCPFYPTSCSSAALSDVALASILPVPVCVCVRESVCERETEREKMCGSACACMLCDVALASSRPVPLCVCERVSVCARERECVCVVCVLSDVICYLILPPFGKCVWDIV